MLFIQVDTNIILRLCLLLNRINKQKNENLLFLSYSEKVSQMTFIRNIVRIERKIYLDKVIESRHNGMIKLITGVRRSGKFFLLFDLFADWLETEGVYEIAFSACRLNRYLVACGGNLFWLF